MKIFCETQVIYRDIQRKQSSRMLKSTLAVGFHHSSKDKDGSCKKDLEIIHFTSKNVIGERYKVDGNVDQIFLKFLKEGKATICFKRPMINLMIKGDPIQLKGFFQALKLGLEGKDSKNLESNILSSTAIQPKLQPLNQLIITSRGDYPIKGFPRYLQKLIINNIKLCNITSEICSLQNLAILNLSNNSIDKIPKELGDLNIKSLNISKNNLGTKNVWQWLKGSNLKNSLRELDLSDNQLTYFPSPLIKCENLITLKLNNNNITYIPFGIRRMLDLCILHISKNNLRSLPSVFSTKQFEILDISNNQFTERVDYNTQEPKWNNTITVPPLWQLCCKAIERYKIPITSSSSIILPSILRDIILESPRCLCNRNVFSYNNFYERAIHVKFGNIKQLIHDDYCPICCDVFLCGPSCKGVRKIYRPS